MQSNFSRFLFFAFSFLLVAGKQFPNDDYSDRNTDFLLTSICSNINSGDPVAIDLGLHHEGFLISHFHRSKTYDTPLPLTCSWRIFQNDVLGEGWAIELHFDKFNIPEGNQPACGDDDDLLDKDEEEEAAFSYSEVSRAHSTSSACANNYVKLSYADEPDEPLGIYCGSGWVPGFYGAYRRAVLVQVHIEQPFSTGFKIHFSRPTAETRVDIQAETCSDDYFMCQGRSGRCVPTTYRCDGFRDCPLGDDERLNCTTTSNSFQLRTDYVDSGCGSPRYQNGMSGSFTSQNYPCNYASSSRCIWYIKTERDKNIIIAFNSVFAVEQGEGAFDDQCLFDSVTIYAYNLASKSGFSLKFVRRLCGQNSPKPFIVRSSSLLIIFETDSTTNNFGFRVNWAAVDKDFSQQLSKRRRLPNASKSKRLTTTTPLALPGSDEEPACLTREGTTLDGLTGVARSPGFATTNGYPPSMFCRWIIRPLLKPGQTIARFEIRFYDFMVQASDSCQADSLHVRHTYRNNKFKMRDVIFCDSNKPSIGEAQVFRTPYELELIFQTDAIFEERGFELGYIAIIASSKTSKAAAIATTTMPVPPVWPRNDGYDCGRSSAEPPARSAARRRWSPFRIVGGMTAKPGSWPFVVELTFLGHHLCGATIVDQRWLITAAHCFKKHGRRQKNGWQVVIGRQSMYARVAWDRRSKILYLAIADIYVHHLYGDESGRKDYDIAFVKLKRPITLGYFAAAACLPSHDTTPGDRCFVVGWGETKGTGGEGLLKQAYMPIISNYQCRGMNAYYYSMVTNSMICAGYESGGTDACQGDSGGPLLCLNREQRWEIHGIVSWGQGCAGWRAPGIYTRVYSYVDMIRRVIAALS